MSDIELVIKIPKELYEAFMRRDFEAKELAIKALEQALEQARPKGKWIILDECANEGVYCSECHKKIFKLEFSPTMKWRNFKYCPNCGRKMEVNADDNT